MVNEYKNEFSDDQNFLSAEIVSVFNLMSPQASIKTKIQFFCLFTGMGWKE